MIKHGAMFTCNECGCEQFTTLDLPNNWTSAPSYNVHYCPKCSARIKQYKSNTTDFNTDGMKYDPYLGRWCKDRY